MPWRATLSVGKERAGYGGDDGTDRQRNSSKTKPRRQPQTIPLAAIVRVSKSNTPFHLPAIKTAVDDGGAITSSSPV
jgi:hypothetical protein